MKAHRVEKTARTRIRKFNGYCEECKKKICSCKSYQYVDESNAAITNNSPYLCKQCYEKRYHVHIKNDVERFKSRLVDTLQRVQSNAKVETLRIDNIIEFIINTD